MNDPEKQIEAEDKENPKTTGGSLSWFEKLEPQLDKYLKFGEVLVVATISLFMCLFVLYEMFWIALAFDMEARQERLATILKMLSDNWKAGLLLLVPLFYRTIRMFLERVKRFAGMETEQEPETIKAAMNPPLVSGVQVPESMEIGRPNPQKQ